MSDLPRLLLCSFDVIPGPSGSSRRLTEYLKALPDRFSVVVLSVKTPDHSHIEKYEGARLLRVPVGAGDLASRIQGLTRELQAAVAIDDRTHRTAGESTRQFERHEQVHIRGRAEPVDVYALPLSAA